MHPIQFASPAEATAEQGNGEGDASPSAATGFLSVLSGVQGASGDAAEGQRRAVQRLIRGGDGTAGLEMRMAHGEGENGAAFLLGGTVRAVEGEGSEGVPLALFAEQAEGGTEAAQSLPAGAFKLMPVRPTAGSGTAEARVGKTGRGGEQAGRSAGSEGTGPQSSGAGSGRATQVQLSWGLVASPSGKGTAPHATDGGATKRVVLGRRGGDAGGSGQLGTKPGQSEGHGTGKSSSQSSGAGQTKRMPEGGRPGTSSQSARRTAQNGRQVSGPGGTPSGTGSSHPGQRAGRFVTASEPNQNGSVRGDAGRPHDAASRRGGEAGSAKKGPTGKEAAQGRGASLLSGTTRAAESGDGREAVRDASSDGRSARTTRDGRSRGRPVRGQSGHRGGQGQQKGGQHGQSAGQQGSGQQNSGGQGQGTKGGPPSQGLSSSGSSSSASGESDARALRASLTRDGASTGSGTQGTDGKSASTSGSNPNTAAAKSNGRAGGAGPPRTMPSAWLNAAKQGPLRTAELAGGWKALEMSLGEDKGTMTVKARQGQEQTAVSVGFSDTRVQAQVVASARQLQEAMQSQYGTDVDLSFGGGDTNESDGGAPDGTTSDRTAARAAGDDAAADEDGGGGSSLRSRGRREWVG